MNLKEIYCRKDEEPIISFEIFPPKNDEDGIKIKKLFEHLKILKKYNPAFISLTYGAGGTNQSLSLDMIKKLQEDLSFNVMPHFTCVGSSIEQVSEYLDQIKEMGIKNILALRGDIPEGMEQKNFDFKYANELVAFIKSKTSLSIGIAGYPEGHMECDDLYLDLKYLKQKVDSGANVIYTQMFFDNDKLFSFIHAARDIGIDVPIIPGILPIMNYKQLEKMLSMARVTVPKGLMEKIDKYKDNPEDIKKLGVDFASEQCQSILDAQIEGLHFYTLNTSLSVSKILDNIGIKS